MILGPAFFARKAPVVARKLLGTYLVRRRGNTIRRYMIVETEAYDGFDDLASHASRGVTQRTEVMFGPSGYWYVYLVYGMHEMLNVVCGPKGYPSAVLLRAVSGIEGPARLTKTLHITRVLNKEPIDRRSGLWIEGSLDKVPKIKQTSRIGVTYAGKKWANKKWRFVLKHQLHSFACQ